MRTTRWIAEDDVAFINVQVLQKGFGGIGVVFIDLDVFYNSTCANITREERAMVNQRWLCIHIMNADVMIMVVIITGGNHHQSHHQHHHSHHPHGSHGHHQHGLHQHGHRQHGHRHHGHRHHHQHHPIISQSNITMEERQGLEWT